MNSGSFVDANSQTMTPMKNSLMATVVLCRTEMSCRMTWITMTYKAIMNAPVNCTKGEP